jgi:hypothetical protein
VDDERMSLRRNETPEFSTILGEGCRGRLLHVGGFIW